MQIHRNGRTIATAAVLGAVLAWAASFAIRDVYLSRALINAGTMDPPALQAAVARALPAITQKHGSPLTPTATSASRRYKFVARGCVPSGSASCTRTQPWPAGSLMISQTPCLPNHAA